MIKFFKLKKVGTKKKRRKATGRLSYKKRKFNPPFRFRVTFYYSNHYKKILLHIRKAYNFPEGEGGRMEGVE